MKRILIPTLLSAFCWGVMAQASDTLTIKSFRYSGPIPVSAPLMVDKMDTEYKEFDVKSLLETPVSLSISDDAPQASLMQACPGSGALHLAAFSLDCDSFLKADILVGGDSHKVYYDGKELKGKELKLEPGTHDVVVKYLSEAGAAPDFDVRIVRTSGGEVTLREDGLKRYSLDFNSHGDACSGVSLSADGRCLAITHRAVLPGGKTSSHTDIISLADGKTLLRTSERVRWMDQGCGRWFTRSDEYGRNLVSSDPFTGEEKVICRNIPEGEFRMVPGGKYLIYTLEKKGPKEGDVHEILTPEDRQPGWRDRKYLARYDIATGVMQPLTFGFRTVSLSDISKDGSKLLFRVYHTEMGPRPTERFSLYVMDVETLESKCLVDQAGFISNGTFSPEADKVLITGTPEAFGGIGNRTPRKRVPSMEDLQLFEMNVESLKVRALTADFNPCIKNVEWSRYDGRIYFTAEEKDLVSLYCLDPVNGEFTKLQDREDNVSRFALSSDAPLLAFSGQSLENGDRVYTYDILKCFPNLIEDISASRFKGVEFGKGQAWEFKTTRGDVINGFYVLPPDFDPHKKYPLIVFYYGGCSPTTRYCVGSYSPQMYAAQGYVYYVINPSGATGFGQEFSSRHVNTAGDVVSDDIIEGTKRFCADHPFIDSRKVGCFSASYGGFMTQLLLSKTNFYATGISHAGISDHTSYWGEGFWGYSYSEVSMAGNYPWTNKDLYVDHSPLYFADRIHTPLLFLHGSADTNVPIGESIQMFTALKLLGSETAFVVVDGENHGIFDYAKKRDWLRTIFAWFSKYLKDDPTWWNEMYPEKNL